MTDRYAIFGNPVAHSLSPLIHGEFARQTGREVRYNRQRVEVGDFAAAARDFFAGGGKGLNITVPFKQDAFQFATSLTARARRAGAVNTLAARDDHSTLGDNTDGVGMVRDIVDNQGWSLAGKRILLMGAGGAVRGVLEPLLGQRPAAVTIANRTPERALALVTAFADLGAVRGCGFDELSGPYDLVINGTSASLSGDLPPLPPGLLRGDTRCYDMMYGAQPTVFLAWAAEQGAKDLADGLGMLVEQAAESFQLWQQVMPRSRPVIQLLRQRLRAES